MFAALAAGCAYGEEPGCVDCEAPSTPITTFAEPKQGDWMFEVGRDVMIELSDGSHLPFARALETDGRSSTIDVSVGDVHDDERGVDIENDRVVVFSSFAEGGAVTARPVVKATWTSPLTAGRVVIPVELTRCRTKLSWIEGDACVDATGTNEPAEHLTLDGIYESRSVPLQADSRPPRPSGRLTRLFRLRVLGERVELDVRTSMHWVERPTEE